MIIDAHVHLKHGDAEKTEYSPEEIIRAMDEAGIDRSVVFAMSCPTGQSIEMALEAARAYPDRLIPFAYALPEAGKDIAAELARAIDQLGFRGIKIHRGQCSLGREEIDPVLRLAAAKKVPCLVDFTGRDQDLERMANAVPEACIIAAHFGQYLCKEAAVLDLFIETASRHPRILLDTSGVILKGKIREGVECLGAERVIFGSDGPAPKSDPAKTACDSLKRLKLEGLGDGEESLVLGGNIGALLKI